MQKQTDHPELIRGQPAQHFARAEPTTRSIILTTATAIIRHPFLYLPYHAPSAERHSLLKDTMTHTRTHVPECDRVISGFKGVKLEPSKQVNTTQEELVNLVVPSVISSSLFGGTNAL